MPLDGPIPVAFVCAHAFFQKLICIHKIVAVLETTCNVLSSPLIAYEINFRNSEIGPSQKMASKMILFLLK